MKKYSIARAAIGSILLAGCLIALNCLAAESETKSDPDTTAPAKPAAKKRTKPAETATTSLNLPGWVKLFDGKTLYGWKETDFAGHGEVTVEDGKILLPVGNNMTGITYTNEVLRMNYEVYIDAARMDGSDFFCGLTFAVGKDPCSLIVGGWGGGLVGLSSIDGGDAANNLTTTFRSFENKKFYQIRLRVTPAHIEAWIDEDKLVDVNLEDRTLSIRIEVEKSKPFGIATWCTTGAIRDIRWRKLDATATPTAPDAKEKK